MTKEQIAALCQSAGFPRPRFDPKRRMAIIEIRVTQRGRPAKADIAELGSLPDINGTKLDAWCGDLGHAAVARFINFKLGTGYTSNDVYKMRSGRMAVYSRIRALVRDFPDGPIDPKT